MKILLLNFIPINNFLLAICNEALKQTAVQSFDYARINHKICIAWIRDEKREEKPTLSKTNLRIIMIDDSIWVTLD